MVDMEALGCEGFRPLKRAEYDRLVELGYFEGERIELLHGFLVAMSPQGAPHIEVIRRLNKWLVIALGDRAVVQPQGPIGVSDDSEPEPDLAVLPAGVDFSRRHAESALLVIEVADSSLRKDRRIKTALYAAAGVAEYWIVNLRGEAIEVHRDRDGDEYRSIEVLRPGDTIALARFPDVAIAVADVLPTLD